MDQRQGWFFYLSFAGDSLSQVIYRMPLNLEQSFPENYHWSLFIDALNHWTAIFLDHLVTLILLKSTIHDHYFMCTQSPQADGPREHGEGSGHVCKAWGYQLGRKLQLHLPWKNEEGCPEERARYSWDSEDTRFQGRWVTGLEVPLQSRALFRFSDIMLIVQTARLTPWAVN